LLFHKIEMCSTVIGHYMFSGKQGAMASQRTTTLHEKQTSRTHTIHLCFDSNTSSC